MFDTIMFNVLQFISGGCVGLGIGLVLVYFLIKKVLKENHPTLREMGIKIFLFGAILTIAVIIITVRG